MAPCPVVELRQCRLRMQLSQAEFAKVLGVPVETYRPWDSGRRAAPEGILLAARLHAGSQPANEPLYPLATLAPLVQVHVRTLRNAARDGRLPVSFDTRTTFRRLRILASVADAIRFRRESFRRRPSAPRPVTPSWCDIPQDYDRRIKTIRKRLGKSQAAFAAVVGAARKAVVYQWESRKRCPSPVFWQRIVEAGVREHSAKGRSVERQD